MQDNSSERLRPHAADRLAQDEESFDLLALAEQLRQEEHPAARGHRQMTIFKKEKVTVVLFVFDPGAELKEHATSGTVTIQCVEGQLVVGTSANEFELKGGQMVALSPNIAHGVRAEEASVMLLTVAR